MTYLISIISEHLLPNYFLAKEFEGKYDRHLLITTERMEKLAMTGRFCKTLGIAKNEVCSITVAEDDLPDVTQKLETAPFEATDRFIVNLTGGTKLISIGTFNTFSAKTDAFYYVPIGVNKIQEVKTGKELLLNYRVNVDEYLSLYGLSFTTENTDRIQDTKGAEFETYITNRIKSENGIKNGHIYRGVKIYREDKTTNDNEIDVMWTADNQLFVGECKVTLNKARAMDWSEDEGRPIAKPAEYLDEIMYKLAAISKDFGLRVNPYIFTRHPFSPPVFTPLRMQHIEKRMKILGIRGLLGRAEINQLKLKI